MYIYIYLSLSKVLDSNMIASALQGDTSPLDREEADDGTDIMDASGELI